jgi:hypothetical protein
MAEMKFDITKVVDGAIKEFRHQGYNVSKWISCKDKMPDDGVNVLIYAGNRMISLAWYDKDMGYFYICDSDYKYNSLDVTHWQPLPEPPKDGEQNEV